MSFACEVFHPHMQNAPERGSGAFCQLALSSEA